MHLNTFGDLSRIKANEQKKTKTYNKETARFRSINYGPVHMYPDIFEILLFFLSRFKRFPRPHVA